MRKIHRNISSSFSSQFTKGDNKNAITSPAIIGEQISIALSIHPEMTSRLKSKKQNAMDNAKTINAVTPQYKYFLSQ